MIAAACAAALSTLAAGGSGVASPTTHPTATSGAASRELDAFARALAGVSRYSATVSIYDRKGAQSQNVVFDYAFSKPSNVTVHVITGPNTGIRLDWNGGATVVARRGSGLAAMFSKTLSLHDPLITTLQGASIDQLSFGAILSHAQQALDRLSVAPGGTVDGVTTNVLTLIPDAPTIDAGVTREVVEMSAATHLPIRVLGYNGATLVSTIGFSNITLQDASD